MHVHAIEITMERATLDQLPRCANEPPCALRAYHPGDDAVWTRIQSDADRYNTITSSLFIREFGSDALEHSRRILFAVSANDEVVGASAAWWGSSPTDEWGRVHWVAVQPSWRGQGIGRKLLVETCHRLRHLGHTKVFLTTSPARLEALHLYRSLGFVPRLTSRDDRNTWHEIAIRMGDAELKGWLRDNS